MDNVLFKFIKNNITSPISLLSGLILIFLVFILPINSFLTEYISNESIRIFIYCFIEIIWVLFWLRYKFHYPKNDNENIGFVIAIETENDKQRIRVRDDFINNLDELINNNELSQLITLIQFNQHQSKRLKEIISFGLSKENKKWQKIKKKIKSHFYIYGSIKERFDKENKYFIDLDALVVHTELDENTKRLVKDGFDNVWFSKISFHEKIEFKGFQLTADLVFLAANYVTGIAALVSRDPQNAFNLHKNLNKELAKFKPLPPNLQKMKRDLNILLAEECFLLALKFYNIEQDYSSVASFLNKSFKYIPTHYGSFILKSVYEFEVKKNPLESLKSVEKAKQYSQGDGTWMYNKAFLLMYLDRFDEALKLYDKIGETTFPNEKHPLTLVIEFNKKIILDDSTNLKSLFILGFLMYKKENNCPMSYEYFLRFIEIPNKSSKYSLLISRVETYLNEIKEVMEI